MDTNLRRQDDQMIHDLEQRFDSHLEIPKKKFMRNEELKRQDDLMILHVEQRLDDHIRIYKENGKESARVAAALERLEEHSRERDAKVDEMFTTYTDFKSGKKAIVWFVGGLFGIFISVGSAYLMVKNIFK